MAFCIISLRCSILYNNRLNLSYFITRYCIVTIHAVFLNKDLWFRSVLYKNVYYRVSVRSTDQKFFFFLNHLNRSITIPWVPLNFSRFFFQWFVAYEECIFHLGTIYSFFWEIFWFFQKNIYKITKICFIWLICNLNIKMRKLNCLILRINTKKFIEIFFLV